MDALLTIVCSVIELGVPLVLSIAWRVRALRPMLAVVLGSISPLVALYVVVVVGWAAEPGGTSRWSFGAMWVITFVPYILCLVLGILLSLLKRPKQPFMRYLLGLTLPSAAGLLLLV